MKNNILIYDSLNPWHNLALEKLLYLSCGEEVVLYLWQNADTVVIGRNQNAWRECDLNAMERDGIKLARRESGGGAVFHDVGNLNFTFITPLAVHDVKKQLQVIQDAAAQYGIETELNGRNDLTIVQNGCKFSGNAFQHNETHALHHGTILIDADTEKVGKYLTPSIKKLEAKGITSVRSRVCNLNAVADEIDVDGMRQAVIGAFESIYGRAATKKVPENSARLAEYEQTLASWEWRIGKTPEFDMALENRFSWGGIELLFTIRQGQIAYAQIFSDALDETMIQRISPALEGCKLSSEAVAQRLNALNVEETHELASWIATQEL